MLTSPKYGKNQSWLLVPPPLCSHLPRWPPGELGGEGPRQRSHTLPAPLLLDQDAELTARRGTAKPAAVPGHFGGAVGTQSAGTVAELAWSPEETGRKRCPQGQTPMAQKTDHSLHVNSTKTRKRQGKLLKLIPVTNQVCETSDQENEIKSV